MFDLAKYGPTSLKKKLATGVAANTLGKVYIAILQLVSVPAFISAWGIEIYGVWLMLTAIPTYLALSDFGFSQAATASMTMGNARGHREEVLRTYQSLQLILCAASGIIVLIALIGIALTRFLDLPQFFEYGGPLLAIATYSAIAQFSRAPLSGLHSTGHYAFGTSVFDTLVFIEGLAAVAVALWGGGILSSALTLVILRLFIVAAMYLALRYKAPWLATGFSHASFEEVGKLYRPAFSALAIPLASAMSLQGAVLIIGAILGPAIAAMYASVRTISRIAVQVVGIFGRASMPELAASSATGQSIRPIISLNLIVIFLTAIPAAILYAAFGPQIIERWTSGAISPQRWIFYIMSISLILQSIWTLSTQLLLALNRHSRLSLLGLTFSALALLLIYPTGLAYGLAGVCITIILSEIIMASAALNELRLLARSS